MVGDFEDDCEIFEDIQDDCEVEVEDDGCDYEPDFEDDYMTAAQADADTLASAGWGTDEDYGFFGGDDDF